MRRWWLLVVVVSALAGCSDGGRPGPKAGEQVVVATFDPEFIPRGVAVDGEGTVYTSGWDGERFVMAVFPEDGGESRRAIPCATAAGADSALYGNVVAAPDGTLFWSMEDQNRVVRLDPDGGGECFAGTGQPGFSGDGGPAVEAQIDRVASLAYDPGAGDLYVADLTGRVRKVDASGVITTVIGPEGMTGQGAVGQHIAFDARRGRLYAKEQPGIAYREQDGTVRVIPRSAAPGFPSDALAPDPTGGDLVTPTGTRPGKSGDLYCAVTRISDTGEVRAVPGGQLEPHCATESAVDARGDIWVVTGDQLIVIRPDT